MRAAVAVFAGATVALGAAAPAAAKEPATGVAQAVEGGTVKLMLNGEARSQSRLKLTVRGTAQPAFCIDFHTEVALNERYAEGTWDESQVRNLGKVLWVLTHGFPNADPEKLVEAAGADVPPGTGKKRRNVLLYFATQTAVWHFSDGVELGDYVSGKGLLPEKQYKVVKQIRNYLVANASDRPEPKPTLTITPNKAKSATAGDKAGPYTVDGPAGPITLTADGGKVVDADGKALTETTNGGRFWLTRDTAGTVQVTAKGKGSVSYGRVFLYQGDHPAQKLILGGSVGESLATKAAAAFTATPAPTPSGGPTLPVTGASVGAAAAAGLALLGAGAVTVLVMRRRRVRFTA